jgi:hypothetical protein
MECLFEDDEDKTNAVIVEGIMSKYGLHPQRLQNAESNIAKMLDQLPRQFKSSQSGGGGGWSFVNACDRDDGTQWTSMQRIMEMLFVLGMGVDKVVCPLPREMWPALPGGVPYYTIK